MMGKIGDSEGRIGSESHLIDDSNQNYCWPNTKTTVGLVLLVLCVVGLIVGLIVIISKFA